MHHTSMQQEGMVAVTLYCHSHTLVLAPLSASHVDAAWCWHHCYRSIGRNGTLVAMGRCSQHPPAELTAMPDSRTLTYLQEGEGGDHILAAIGTAASTMQRHEYLQRRPELKHNGGGANGEDKGPATGEAQQD